MKKSRVLIPALAMIAFSTAASIAGSVAWFTASRTATVSASSFSVVKTSANLNCEVAEGVGTYVDEDHDNTITLTHEDETTHAEITNVLTDGSFNHLSGNIYQPNEAGNGFDANSEVAVEDAEADPSLLERGTTEGADDTTTDDDGTIYSAVTFHITFSISFGSATGDYGLFLDNTSGKTAFECEDANLYTAKGFRMAFFPADSTGNGKATVLADLQTNDTWDHDSDAETAAIEKIRYVASTSNFGGTAYASQYIIDNQYDDDLPDEGTAEATVSSRPDYLGKFAFEANTDVELEFIVVCWFDGNDPEIRNRASADQYQTVTSELHFEAIKLG